MAIDGKNTTFPRTAWAPENKQELRKAIDASIAATGQSPAGPGRAPPAAARYGVVMPPPEGCVDVPKMKRFLSHADLPELQDPPFLGRMYKEQLIENKLPVDGLMKEIYFNGFGEFFLKVTYPGRGGPTEPKWYGPGQLPKGAMLDSCEIPDPAPAPRYGMPMPRPRVEEPPPASPLDGMPMPEDWK